MAAASWKARIILGSAVALQKAVQNSFSSIINDSFGVSVLSFPNPINKAETMPTKRPLCNYDGTIKELASTDTLLGGGTMVSKEVPSGTKNSSNQSFTLAYTPTAGSEQVYLNGILQNQGYGNDYTISGGTIIFTVAPASSDIILVTYWK